jgi:phosphoribosylformylglycinamidine synthase
VVRVHGTNRGLAVTADCTPRYCKADPKAGGAQAVAEAWRNLTAVGAKPLAVTDCMNFGNPERPEIMGQFAGCVEGMAEACRALDFPVVSGNVSLYNETSGQAILPTPQIGAVGLIDDLSARARAAFGAEGETIVLLGETRGHLGQSLWLREVAGLEGGPPPPVELAVERKIGDFVRGLIRDGLARSCHDLSDGGLLVALAEMALASGLGCEVALPAGAEANAFWFGEDQGRYLLSLSPAGAEAVLAKARVAGAPALSLGRVGGDALTLAGGDHISLQALRDAHEGFLPRWMAGEDR